MVVVESNRVAFILLLEGDGGRIRCWTILQRLYEKGTSREIT